MPELPEVETTRQGLLPHVINRVIKTVNLYTPRLRWDIPMNISKILPGQKIIALQRRGKYLLLKTQKGTLMIHLGMSGCLQVLPRQQRLKKHDHFELMFSQCCVRLNDPRRFGAVLWTEEDPLQHHLLRSLGPEPLSEVFDANYLYTTTRHRQVAIKQLIMNSRIVVGVGNIYACEALFLAGISPFLKSNKISFKRCELLVAAIKTILTAAIKAGGTTLKDYYGSDGKPGYFAFALKIYGKQNDSCQHCQSNIKSRYLNQRNTFYCPHCQR